MTQRRSGTPRECECGCGGWTRGGRFLPGHDAKLKGILLNRARAGDTDALAELERRGWLGRVAIGRKFGVEIEFLVKWTEGHYAYQQVIEAMHLHGLTCSYEGYNHRVMATWKIVTDSSLVGDNGYVGYELVSPPLQGQDGLAQLEKACGALAAIGAKINNSCGLHVHHEAKDLTANAVRRVIQAYTHNQDIIESVLAPSRGNGNTYCRPWSSFEMENLERCTAIRQMAEVAERYRAVNLQSYPKYGTIELRQHQGTIEYKKISAWIRLGQALLTTAGREATTTTARAATTTTGALEDLLAALGLTDEDKRYWHQRQAKFAAAAA